VVLCRYILRYLACGNGVIAATVTPVKADITVHFTFLVQYKYADRSVTIRVNNQFDSLF